jgi:hypothetical protein
MAHYTQATQPGWHYLPVGSGSGMLPEGGSYVSLVSAGGCSSGSGSGGGRGGSDGSGSGSGSGGDSDDSGLRGPIEYTLVVQAMEWAMSKCFKDTHPKFEVAPAQNLTFQLDSALVAALARGRCTASGGVGGGSGSSGGGGGVSGCGSGGVALYARRTLLRADDEVLPAKFVPLSKRTNTYFEATPIAPLATTGAAAGRIELTVRANEVWTVSTVPGAGSRGDGSAGPDNGLAPIPMPLPWHSSTIGSRAPPSARSGADDTTGGATAPSPRCFALTGHSVDSPLVLAVPAMDQQGVWESRPSRSASAPLRAASAPARDDASPATGVATATATTPAAATNMQQVVPSMPDEWHHGCGLHPYSFVGPAVNLSAGGSSGQGSTVSVDVLPSGAAGGWAGIGFGRPSAKTAPEGLALRVWSNGSWAFAGHSGVVPNATTTSRPAALNDEISPSPLESSVVVWYSLSLQLLRWPSASGGSPATASEQTKPAYVAKVNGKVVASGSTWAGALPSMLSSFATLSSSFSAGSNSEFKNLCLDIVESDTPGEPSPTAPTPPPGPGPAPGPAPSGRGVTYFDKTAGCATDSAEFWTFSGEDQGEVGTLIPAVNGSLCLDLDGGYVGGELALATCASDPSSEAFKSQRWGYDSTHGGIFSSQETRACLKPGAASKQCHFCLDVKKTGAIDLFDCKVGDSNQVWAFDCAGGAGPVSHRNSNGCLAATA